MRVFITGIAGFIGFHVAQDLIKKKIEVIGCDNFNDYYDPNLKHQRAKLIENQKVKVISADISELEIIKTILRERPTHVLHLAAQAGVRYSLTHPQTYVKSNLQGFTNILELMRKIPEVPLIYASSSSVYGLNKKLPYSVEDRVDQQASFYGVTKRANELMAANYMHLFGIRAIGLRYFTVYGPWGRPDMALFNFTKSIYEGKPIELFNHGHMQRDFTYIDDIVAGTVSALTYKGNETLFNLGNHKPVTLLRFVEILEECIGIPAKQQLMPMQLGEVVATYADIKESQKGLNFYPKTSLEEGIPKFVGWYNTIYQK